MSTVAIAMLAARGWADTKAWFENDFIVSALQIWRSILILVVPPSTATSLSWFRRSTLIQIAWPAALSRRPSFRFVFLPFFDLFFVQADQQLELQALAACLACVRETLPLLKANPRLLVQVLLFFSFVAVVCRV